MWLSYLILSVSSLIAFGVIAVLINLYLSKQGKKISLFYVLFAGVFVSAFFMFMPIHIVTTESGYLRPVLLSLFNSMQIFGMGTEFNVVSDSLPFCEEGMRAVYSVWAAAIFVLAPVFSFSFVLSLFKNISAYIQYFLTFFKNVYIFSELNEKSLVLAEDIKRKHGNVGIIFNDVFEDNGEQSFEFKQRAKRIGAICFKKDILAVHYRFHSPIRDILFFTIGESETENLNQTIHLIETYKERKNTHIYVFSTKIASELLLATHEKGEIKVRRINEVQSLINRVLYQQGEIIFDNAIEAEDGVKDISAVVVGMGNHGTEMVKALSWFGQMDGYRIKITAFDKDKLADEKFRALAPELMSEDYNGVIMEGEAQYTIKIHPKCDVESYEFDTAISKIKGATYVFVSLGSDDMNIRTAIHLRMLFERIGCKPIIHAVLTSTQQTKALKGITNFNKQPYKIDFVGDLESSFAEDVILDSELEEDALQRHLKWGEEDKFWAYEYNYRSSVASAIHMRARIKCNIPGSDKPTQELTEQERDIIEVLEHKRWNAYMRAEGYVYSGSPDESSRNDLAKTHHNLVDFTSLSDEDKRKDSNVGSK